MAEVEVAVAGIVGFEVRGFAAGVEDGVVVGEQGRAESVALAGRVNGEVGEVVVGFGGPAVGEQVL